MTAVLSLRPSFALYRQRLRAMIGPAILLVAVDYFRTRSSLPVYIATVVGIASLVAVFVWLYYRNTLVECGPRSLAIRNAIGAKHTVNPANLHEVVLLTSFALYKSKSAPPVPRLFVLDEDGRSVLTMKGQSWTPGQMHQLIEKLALPVQTVDHPMTSRSTRERYPKALSAIAAHPVAVQVAIVVVIVVLVTVTMIVVGSSQG